MLVTGSPRLGMNDDIGRNNLRDALFDAIGERMNLFEICGSRDTDGGINKITIPGAADADTIRAQNSFNFFDASYDPFLKSGRGCIEESIQSATAQLRAHPENDAGDGEAGKRVGIGQPRKIPAIATPNQRHPNDDDQGAPDIRRKMECIGFKSFAVVAPGDFVEGSGAREINGKRGEKNQESKEVRLDVHRVEKQPLKGFKDDVNGGEDKQAGFDEGGEIFKFAVAVGVALVGGLVRNTHGKKGDDRGDQVETRMEGLGENTQAVRADDQESFQAKKEGCGADAEEGRALLFLDGSLQVTGKDHKVRLQQVAEIP